MMWLTSDIRNFFLLELRSTIFMESKANVWVVAFVWCAMADANLGLFTLVPEQVLVLLSTHATFLVCLASFF